MPNIIEVARQVLGEVVANSLNTEGCLSVEEFLRKYDIIKEANKYTVGEKNVGLLRCAVISQHKPLLKSAQHLSQRALQNTIVLRTGSSQVDKVLSGGLYTCEVVEVYGPAAIGKTQLAFQTAAVACSKHGCNVIYVDSSNSFSSERVAETFHHYNGTEEAINNWMKRIMVYKIFDVFELQNMLHQFIAARKAKSDPFNLEAKLLIIDNITSLLSPVLGHKFHEGYALANTVSSLLRKIANEFYLAVLVINGTVTGQSSRGLPKPALGIHWQQMADKKVLISGFNSNKTPAVYNCQLVASKKHGLML